MVVTEKNINMFLKCWLLTTSEDKEFWTGDNIYKEGILFCEWRGGGGRGVKVRVIYECRLRDVRVVIQSTLSLMFLRHAFKGDDPQVLIVDLQYLLSSYAGPSCQQTSAHCQVGYMSCLRWRSTQYSYSNFGRIDGLDEAAVRWGQSVS